MTRTIKFNILFTALVLLLLSACGNPQVKKDVHQKTKDTLVLAFNNEPEAGFDPITGWGRYGSPLFQSTLLKRDDDLHIVHDLATKYTVSDDGLQWSVELREDVKFSDGKRLTAEDVVFTYEQAQKSGSVVDLKALQTVEAINDTKVKFTLKTPQSTFVNHLIATGIVPKHAYDENYAEHPIGSGPFQFVQWDKGQQLIIEKNPYYYGTQSPFNKLTFLFLQEDAAFAAAQSGQVDFAYIPPAFSQQKVDGMRLEAVQTVDNRGITFPMVPSGQKTKDGIPIGNDVTSDLAIRQAIDVAVNREKLIAGILEGYGTPAFTSVDHLPWWNEETMIEDGDIDQAKDILAEAGWQMNAKTQRLEKDGQEAKFDLYYLANDEIRQSLSIAVADTMRPLGIDIQVKGASWDVIGQNMHAEAVMMGWGSHNPQELYHIYGSDQAGLDYFNTGYYSNKTVDHYFDLALQAKTEEAAMEFWKKAQWDGTTGFSSKGDVPWVWLVNINHLYLVNENLDIGKQCVHVHGHAWPSTDNIVDWKWKAKGE